MLHKLSWIQTNRPLPRLMFVLLSQCEWNQSFFLTWSQMEFDEKELRKEISYAIKNIHGVRQVETALHMLQLALSFCLCSFSLIKTCGRCLSHKVSCLFCSLLSIFCLILSPWLLVSLMFLCHFHSSFGLPYWRLHAQITPGFFSYHAVDMANENYYYTNVCVYMQLCILPWTSRKKRCNTWSCFCCFASCH